MKLVTFLHNGKAKPGFLSGDGGAVYPIDGYATMNELIRKCPMTGVQFLSEHATFWGQAIPLSEVKLLAPIPQPDQDVICLGMNYAAHLEEARKFHEGAFSRDERKAVYFSKRVNEAVAPGDPIQAHTDLVSDLDYECELAVILGRDAKNVPRELAYQYVFGYTILNDVSARALQTSHKQFYFGKSLDGFTPMGPCIVTADEVGTPPVLRITTKVNGELRQDSTTDMLIFDIPHIISELSRGMTLKAGTIIATGTPSGVAMGMEQPVYLKPGDVVECFIEGIGTLRNPIK